MCNKNIYSNIQMNQINVLFYQFYMIIFKWNGTLNVIHVELEISDQYTVADYVSWLNLCIFHEVKKVEVQHLIFIRCHISLSSFVKTFWRFCFCWSYIMNHFVILLLLKFSFLLQIWHYLISSCYLLLPTQPKDKSYTSWVICCSVTQQLNLIKTRLY